MDLTGADSGGSDRRIRQVGALIFAVYAVVVLGVFVNWRAALLAFMVFLAGRTTVNG